MAVSTTSPHDDVYVRLRKKISGWAAKNKIKPEHRDYLLAVPDLFHLLTRLVIDARVATRHKAWIGVAIAYVLSPLDLIPDVLGPIGYLDDLLVMVIVLDSILKKVPRHVVEEHWAGTDDLLGLIRQSLDRADQLVGKGLYDRIRAWLEAQGVMRPRTQTSPPPVPVAPRASASSKSGPGSSTGRKTASKKKTTSRKKKTASRKKTTSRKKTSSGKTGGASSSSRRKTSSSAGGKTIGPREGRS